ncbi:MAG: sodium:solute symporter family protein, partial [Firmicutes bacterium]|nr:sodium:solute symporter family protein [Bacillota bacterium]
DWAVGGRKLPIYVIVGTQYATAMGGGILVAHVGIGYSSGWSTITYGLLVSIGIAFLAVIAKWLREQEFTTVPDILEKIYGFNRFVLIVAALMTIIVPFGWMCAQLVAFGKIFSSITGIPMQILMVIFAVITLAYVLPAGLTSVAWTDFVFGCFMVAMSLFSALFAIRRGGGWSTIVGKVPAQIAQFPAGMGAVGAFTVALWSLAILPGTLTNQMYYQRIYAIDNVKYVRTSLIISALVILTADIWAGVVGLAVRSMQPGLASEMASGWFLTQLPTWFLALYSGFIVATIMSTIDSGVQSVVVNLTRDIYQKLINPHADDKKLLWLSRTLSVVMTFLSLILAIAWPQALSWLVATYAYSAAALLFPIFLGYFLKNANFLTPQGAVGGMIGGFIGCAWGQINKVAIPYVAYGLTGSLLGLLLVSAMTRKSYYSRIAANR